MNANQMELNQEELEQGNGGALIKRSKVHVSKCSHGRKFKTGNEREDSRFFFWSQHQYEYRCPDCGTTIWVNEER